MGGLRFLMTRRARCGWLDVFFRRVLAGLVLRERLAWQRLEACRRRRMEFSARRCVRLRREWLWSESLRRWFNRGAHWRGRCEILGRSDRRRDRRRGRRIAFLVLCQRFAGKNYRDVTLGSPGLARRPIIRARRSILRLRQFATIARRATATTTSSGTSASCA